MDKLFLNIYLTYPVWYILCVVAVTILGASLVRRYLVPKMRLRRVGYFLVIAALNFLFTIAQISRTYLPEAVSSGMFAPLLIFAILTIPAHVALIYWASAARSNDICGSARLAWMGWVPFVNLWLMTKPGHRSDERDRFDEYGRDVLLLAGAFVLLWLNTALLGELGEVSVAKRVQDAVDRTSLTSGS